MPNPRKPTHLRIVTGNAGNRPLPTNEPAPPPGAPPMPARLSPAERAAWRRFVKLLGGMGVLTKADGPVIERMVACYVTSIEARASYARPVSAPRRDPITGETVTVEIAAGGQPTYVSQGKDGAMLRTRPELAVIADADRRLLAYLCQFGLTPAARSKVQVAPKRGGDPLASYFAD